MDGISDKDQSTEYESSNDEDVQALQIVDEQEPPVVKERAKKSQIEGKMSFGMLKLELNHLRSLDHISKIKVQQSVAMSYTSSNEPNLFQKAISVKSGASMVDLNVVYEDTDHNGDTLSRGTVIMTHGAPGSHKDFKYVTPHLKRLGIRSIGVNWPGLGYSSYNNRLQNTNEERAQLLQGLVDSLGLESNLVFLGHSRGSEDALRMAANNQDKTAAAVLVNPIGFRPHRGVRPFWGLKVFVWIWNLSVLLQPFLSPIYYLVYQTLGLKAKTGHIAGICLTLMAHSDFSKQKDSINLLKGDDCPRVLVACSGKDHLIESELTKEFVCAFHRMAEVVCTTTSDEPDIVERATEVLGYGRHLSVFFKEENHFLQKHRALFLAEMVSVLLTDKNK
uniref:AB hydrolase-1 domain-containing protein n=1 Tax=Ditylenchus dipsaci TaxID=166011 RepID=A0A915D729_9BILA